MSKVLYIANDVNFIGVGNMRLKHNQQVGRFEAHRPETHSNLTLLTRAKLWMAAHPLLERALSISLPITAGAATLLTPAAIHAQEPVDAGVDGGTTSLDMTNATPVSLRDLERYEEETAILCPKSDILNSTQVDSQGGYATSIRIVLNGHVLFAVAGVNQFTLSQPNGIVLNLDGRPISVFDLTPLKDTYREMTGKEMVAVKLIVEKGTDTQSGEYFQFYVIPLNGIDGKIERGVPIFTEAFLVVDKKAYSQDPSFVD